MRKYLVSGLLLTAMVLGTGCRSAGKHGRHARPCPAPGCPPGVVVPGPAVFPGATPAPPPGGLVPGPVPGPGAAPPPAPPPLGAAPPPPPPNGAAPPPPPGAPPPAFPPSTSQRPDFRWEPAPGQLRLETPQPMPPDVKEDRKLYPPESAEPPLQNPGNKPLPPSPPKKEDKIGAPPALPVGIPQFTMVKEQVANGLRPSLEEGLDWLKDNGYKAVLFLHKPGDTDAADRKQAEKRGLKFLPLEVSPRTLSKKMVDEFAATVKEQSHLPLFVYDREGDLAGGMWYLYFRLAEQIDDDSARVRISSLGFRENREDAHRQMWLAIQKLLAELNRS